MKWWVHSTNEVSKVEKGHNIGANITYMVSCCKSTIRSSDLSPSVLQPLEGLLQFWLASPSFYHFVRGLVLEK